MQGRGSAANSAVCYSLGITAVDPVGMDLLFERFLSEERGEWPDIDLDLPSGDRRERVIQHIYQKYGQQGAAMTANVITYRGRSAAREVGKVLSMEPGSSTPGEDDESVRMGRSRETLQRNLHDGASTAQTRPSRSSAALAADPGSAAASRPAFRRHGDLPGTPRRGRPARKRLDARPRRHPVGQGRLRRHGDREGRSARPRHDGGAAGCAGSGELSRGRGRATEARRTSPRASGLDLATSRLAPRASRLDLAHLPPNDPAVYRMLQEADTIGIFQVESRAQMATLPRLQPETFYDIVVEVAIIRPGPIVGQMVHPYLKRRQGQEPVAYPHPSLEPILARTLGVPLFQEQLLRMAMVAAGFSGGQAEELRRAFGFKRSEKRMQQIEGKLRAGMARQGIAGDAAEEIIRSITSFALYGFPESHAASFALLVYASAYLKAHYPAAFYAAILNNQPMGFYHPSTLVKDAQRHGVRFAPIDVQVSNWLCRVEPDGRVRLGLMYVNGLRQEVGKAIEGCAEVEGRGPRAETRGRRTGGLRRGNRSVPKMWMRRRVDAREAAHAGDVLQHLLASVDACCALPHPRSAVGDSRFVNRERSSALDPRPSVSFPRPSDPADGDSPRRDRDARGDRRAERVRLRSADGAVAGGAGNQAGWRVIPDRGPRTEHRRPKTDDRKLRASFRGPRLGSRLETQSPLIPMTMPERLIADFSGTGLTIGPHPMSMRRSELALRGVLRAVELSRGRHGRRVRVAGAVITRQRPGTAKGFVFLTLEDETGIANIIVRPDLFSEQRGVIVQEPYLLVEGVLQIQEGVTSVRAERFSGLGGQSPPMEAHDFR